MGFELGFEKNKTISWEMRLGPPLHDLLGTNIFQYSRPSVSKSKSRTDTDNESSVTHRTLDILISNAIKTAVIRRTTINTWPQCLVKNLFSCISLICGDTSVT